MRLREGNIRKWGVEQLVMACRINPQLGPQWGLALVLWLVHCCGWDGGDYSAQGTELGRWWCRRLLSGRVEVAVVVSVNGFPVILVLVCQIVAGARWEIPGMLLGAIVLTITNALASVLSDVSGSCWVRTW